MTKTYADQDMASGEKVPRNSGERRRNPRRRRNDLYIS